MQDGFFLFGQGPSYIDAKTPVLHEGFGIINPLREEFRFQVGGAFQQFLPGTKEGVDVLRGNEMLMYGNPTFPVGNAGGVIGIGQIQRIGDGFVVKNQFPIDGFRLGGVE